MIGVLVMLAACGVQEPMMQPNPPPEPAPVTTGGDAGEVTVTGIVTSVSAESRTWVQVGEGQTVIGHLPATGVLTIDGRTVLAGDLQLGMTVKTHGHQEADLLVVIDATVVTAPAVEGGQPVAVEPVVVQPVPEVAEPVKPPGKMLPRAPEGEPKVVEPAPGVIAPG